MEHGSRVRGTKDGETSDGINWFELFAALILGASGIFTALVSFQAELWTGKMSQLYTQANRLSSEAGAETSRAVVQIARDAAIDVQAKQHILEGMEDADDKKHANAIATYLYIHQMSEPGYRAMGFTKEDREQLLAGATSKIHIREDSSLIDPILAKALDNDLSSNESYRAEMMGKSVEVSTESEKLLHDGVEAKENADKFKMGDVIFAVSLFFTGISLVFFSRVRWFILIGGGAFLIGGIIYMATIHWTFS